VSLASRQRHDPPLSDDDGSCSQLYPTVRIADIIRCLENAIGVAGVTSLGSSPGHHLPVRPLLRRLGAVSFCQLRYFSKSTVLVLPLVSACGRVQAKAGFSGITRLGVCLLFMGLLAIFAGSTTASAAVSGARSSTDVLDYRAFPKKIPPNVLLHKLVAQ